MALDASGTGIAWSFGTRFDVPCGVVDLPRCRGFCPRASEREENEKMRRHTTTLVALALGLSALTGCSDSAAPAGNGAASASITDGAGPGPVPQRSAQTYGASGAQAVSGSYSGSIGGSAQVMIYSDVQGWVSLSSPRSVSLQMQAGDTAAVATAASVPADTYTRVRVVLDGCHANLSAGSVVGGVTLSSSVSLTLGGSDDRVEIDVDVPAFTVSASGEAAVHVNLRSESWVNENNAGAQMVTDAEMQAAATASVVTS